MSSYPPKILLQSILLWGERMGLNIGASPVDNVMFGTQQVDKIMLGSSLVWEAIQGDRLMGWRDSTSTTLEIVELNPDTGAVVSIIGTISNVYANDAGVDFGGTTKRAFCTFRRSGDSGYGVGEISLKNAAVINFLPDVYTTNSGAGIGGNANILMTSRWSDYLTERNQDSLAVTKTGAGRVYVQNFDGVGEYDGGLAVRSDTESGEGGYWTVSFNGLSKGIGATGSNMRYLTSFGGTDSRYFDSNRDVENVIEELQVPPDNRTVINTVAFSGDAFSLFGIK